MVLLHVLRVSVNWNGCSYSMQSIVKHFVPLTRYLEFEEMQCDPVQTHYYTPLPSPPAEPRSMARRTRFKRPQRQTQRSRPPVSRNLSSMQCRRQPSALTTTTKTRFARERVSIANIIILHNYCTFDSRVSCEVWACAFYAIQFVYEPEYRLHLHFGCNTRFAFATCVWWTGARWPALHCSLSLCLCQPASI